MNLVSIILSKINNYERIFYARNCFVKEINKENSNNFLKENHLQGKDKSSIRLGLFNNKNELLSVMTLGNRKISGAGTQFEIIRFCNKKYTKVIGAASKLFTYFLNNYKFDNITTYVDKRFSNGDVYNKLGFQYSHDTKPNYFYIDLNKPIRRINRLNFQKHKLKNKLDYFNSRLTEHENMLINNFCKIYDCGNLVYKYR